MFEAMQSMAIPVFASLNGSLTEADGGGSKAELINRDGKRQSIFRSYIWPYMDRPNLTVLTYALVTWLLFEDRLRIATCGRMSRGILCVYAPAATQHKSAIDADSGQPGGET
jgi:choline dehydrogenase-like flavoprotein